MSNKKWKPVPVSSYEHDGAGNLRLRAGASNRCQACFKEFDGFHERRLPAHPSEVSGQNPCRGSGHYGTLGGPPPRWDEDMHY